MPRRPQEATNDPNMVQEAQEAKNDTNMLSWGTLPPSRSPVASWPRGVVLLGGRRQEGFSPLEMISSQQSQWIFSSDAKFLYD